MRSVKAFFEDEAGSTAIEYGLIAALLAALVIGAMTLTGGGIQALFGAIVTRATSVWDAASAT